MNTSNQIPQIYNQINVSKSTNYIFKKKEKRCDYSTKAEKPKVKTINKILALQVSSTCEWNTKLGNVVVMSLLKHMKINIRKRLVKDSKINTEGKKGC